MAENIQHNINVARAGLNLDSTLNQVEKGFLTWAINAQIESWDGGSVNYQNEQANQLCTNFPDGYKVIGIRNIIEEGIAVVWLVNPSTGDSEYGKITHNTCEYQTIINDPCLGFSIEYPILKHAHKNNCGLEVYWVDALNRARYIQHENLPYREIINPDDPCDVTITDEIDCNKLNLQPNFKIPEIDVQGTDVGGELLAGDYQFAFQYSNAIGEAYTSFYSVTNPASVFDGTQATKDFNFPVNQSIALKITNIDTTGIFDYFNIAVIKTINNISSVELVGTYNILGDEMDVLYTGEGKTDIKLSIDGIFQKYNIVDSPGDLTVAQDILILRDLKDEERISYQEIANKITLNWATYRLRGPKAYADPVNVVDFRGYMRDEVYPFEVVFLLDNGYQTDGFHIPGRVATDYDLEIVDNDDVPQDEDPECATEHITLPRWKVYNTGSVKDTIFTPCDTSDDVPPPQPSQLIGTMTVSCSDAGCTQQGIISIEFNFNIATPQAFVLQIGELSYSSSTGEKFYMGDALFTPPAGATFTHYDSSHGYRDTPFEITIPSGVTTYTTSGTIILPGTIQPPNYPTSVRGGWTCQSCQRPISDLYVKPKSPVSFTLTMTSDSDIMVHTTQNLSEDVSTDDENPDEDVPCVGDNCYEGLYQVGDMAYWESTDTYPCNSIYGDLEGKPIRHHKFPDSVITHIHDSIGGIYPIGVQIDVQQIVDLINNSSLTDEQKSRIQGVKIVRGNRATGGSVVAKGLLTNVLKYKTEGNRIDSATGSPDSDDNSSEDSVRRIIDSGYDYTRKAHKESNASFFLSGALFVGPKLAQNQRYTEAERAIRQVQDSNNLFTQDNVDALTYASAKLQEAIDGSGNDPRGKAHAQAAKALIDGAIQILEAEIALRETLGDVDVTASITDESDKYMFFPNYLFNDVRVDSVTGLPKDFFIDNTIIDEDSKKRWTFHSPDTSFYQPHLGNILKLETAEYGVSSGHIREVQKHARYQFISATGYITALLAGLTVGFASGTYGVAAINVFDGSAMFTAYQAFLEILYKTVPRKNFANQFNAVGNYKKYFAVPNNLGKKQRRLDLYTYLSPGMLNVGDDYTVNNFQRESSVYLRSPIALPYTHEVSPSIPKDASKLAGATYDIINTPISSFYASLKNVIPNQYGQLYSYETIDTGWQMEIDTSPNTYEKALIFGGDVFINRFAYKSKLPFFIDNRVGFPDDADISYNELSNVGRVKYWFSTDVTANTSFFDSFFATMTQNFFWPRISELYYNGMIFLFAYGIPYFYCESTVNVDMRQAYNGLEGDFYPRVSSGIPDEWLQEKNVSIQYDNTYWYNKTFSKQNKETYFSHIPPDWDFSECRTSFPFGAIFSEPVTDTPNPSKRNNWRIFKPASRFDFPQNYGALTSIDGIENKQVLARFENKTLLYNALLTAPTSSADVYLGQSLFSQKVPPVDYADTDTGYVGCQHKMLIKTEYGHISADSKRGQVFLFQGTSVKDLTAERVSKWMTKYFGMEINKYIPNVPIDNQFLGLGVHGVFDTLYNRLILTKLDYIPLYDDISYEGGKFYRDGEEVQLSDSDSFMNNSFTISYDFNIGAWASFHTYIPNYFLGAENYFYSGINSSPASIWTHNISIDRYNNFYSSIHPYTLEYPYAYQYNDEILQNVKDYTKAIQYTSWQEFIETDDVWWNEAILYNNQQCSGTLKLTPKPLNNLSQSIRYPVYNSDSKEILYTKRDSFYQLNTFWSVTKSSKTPIWSPSTQNLSIFKELNQSNCDYGKRSFNKAPLRAKDLKIRLTLNNRDDVKLISQMQVAESQVSYI